MLLAGAGLAAVAFGVVVLGLGRQEGAGTPAASPRLVAVPQASFRASPVPSPASADACTATVEGTDPAAVASASQAAGGGTVCFPAGRYDGPLEMSVEDQTWRLDPEATIAGSIMITAPGAWLTGGTLELPSDDPWREGIAVDADRATIENVTFNGGGQVIGIRGRDGTQIVDNRFAGHSGTAIFLWGYGRGADDTLIEGNTITQDATIKSSPISSRAAEDVAEGVFNQRLTVRSNTIDQGGEETGWFGVELKLTPDAVIVDNDIRGGATLVSLPDSDRAIVSGNRLDLRGTAYWGVEIANSDDVTVESNTVIGDGPSSTDVAVAMNTGSLRAYVTDNRVTDLTTLVDLTGDDHEIVDNCIESVANIVAFRSSAGPNVDIQRNGPCPNVTAP